MHFSTHTWSITTSNRKQIPNRFLLMLLKIILQAFSIFSSCSNIKNNSSYFKLNSNILIALVSFQIQINLLLTQWTWISKVIKFKIINSIKIKATAYHLNSNSSSNNYYKWSLLLFKNSNNNNSNNHIYPKTNYYINLKGYWKETLILLMTTICKKNPLLHLLHLLILLWLSKSIPKSVTMSSSY